MTRPVDVPHDISVTAVAAELVGDEVNFAVLADGSIIVDEDQPDGSVEPLADAIERRIKPPYRATANRAHDDEWSVGASGIVVAELPVETEGEVIELAVLRGERHLLVDGQPAEIETPELDAIGGAVGTDYALVADRLDDTNWEVEASPL